MFVDLNRPSHEIGAWYSGVVKTVTGVAKKAGGAAVGGAVKGVSSFLGGGGGGGGGAPAPSYTPVSTYRPSYVPRPLTPVMISAPLKKSGGVPKWAWFAGAGVLGVGAFMLMRRRRR